jgi:ABC-2 type transport system permease protein
VIAALRVFFVGGAISYRALFNWISPLTYVCTLLGSPLFQILFFAYLGRFSHVRNDSFYVVGNAMQASAMASVYGSVMVIGNERYFATLGPLLATPANRIALFLGRALPFVLNGMLVSTFGFGVGLLLLHFQLTWSQIPPLALTLVVTVASCTCFGLTLGAIGLRARDVLFLANVVYFSMLLFCGVNVPLEALPGWMQAIGRALPLTHGIAAARRLVAGASLRSVETAVLTELAIGAAYAFAGYVLFRVFESESRRRATLESY